ncbi:MAG: hypothetical protein Q7W45_08705 [Bacteroidota bacterium]|nr:hypothetical protein [Bacteroidota bacterium]MDP3144243.1 hypothetical protein [Bacteroidota bacterium]
MLKHPKIKSVQPAGPCSFSNQLIVNPQQLSPYAFQRHLRKASLYLKPNPSLKIYQLPCCCYVWVYASGIRQLSALPF